MARNRNVSQIVRCVDFLVIVPCVVSVLIAVYLTVYRPEQALILADSPRYIEFKPLATAGYPMFLKLFGLMLPDLDSIVYVQLWIYAAAVACLCAVLAQLTKSATVGGIAALTMLINPEVNQYLFTIMTEPPSYALTALALAAFGAIVLTGRTRYWLAASVAIGLAITVRASNAAYIMPLLIALLIYRRSPAQRWPVRLAAAIVPLVIIVAGERLIWNAYHEGPRRTLAGVTALGKGAMVEGGVPPATAASELPMLQPLRRALADDLTPVRTLLDQAPNLQTWCRLAFAYETFFEYRYAIPERQLAEGLMPENPDGALIEVSRERVLNAAGDYADLTLRHLACMWTLTIGTPSETAVYRTYINDNRPLPFESEVSTLIDPSKGPARAPLASLVVAIFAATGIVTAGIACLALPALIRGRPLPPALNTASLAAAMAHSNLLLTALVGIGIARYIIGLWVPITTAMILGGWYFGGCLLSVIRRRRLRPAATISG
jgi:hypothetical protein